MVQFNCAKCGKKFGFIERTVVWKGMDYFKEYYEKLAN